MWCSHTGNHPQEVLAKFGYRVQEQSRKKLIFFSLQLCTHMVFLLLFIINFWCIDHSGDSLNPKIFHPKYWVQPILLKIRVKKNSNSENLIPISEFSFYTIKNTSLWQFTSIHCRIKVNHKPNPKPLDEILYFLFLLHVISFHFIFPPPLVDELLCLFVNNEVGF